MDRLLAEEALSRVYDYLSAMGIEISREVTLQVLRLVEAGLALEQEDPLRHIMSKVRENFGLPQSDLPPVAPGVIRGSMGYEPR